MKRRATLFLWILFIYGINFVQAQQNDATAIKKAMNQQLIAWNNGDVNSFMQTYWQSDSLMFIGKNGATYGWQKTLENYKKNYPNTAAMGKLDFDILEIKKISVNYFFVVGKWHLTRSIGNIGGAFSLLFKKINGKWLIIADHSS